MEPWAPSARIWQTIRDTMILLCIAIGLAPAFKMKFWNIGAEGQILIGGACSAAVMIYAGDKMSPILLLIVMFIASAIGGMIWGMIRQYSRHTGIPMRHCSH